MQKGRSKSEMRGVQENFTLFGVGCSFSDNNDEKYKRSKIMDQARTSNNEEEKMSTATERNRVS